MNAVQDQPRVVPANAAQIESPKRLWSRSNGLLLALGLGFIASIALFFTPELGRLTAGTVAGVFLCAGAIVTVFAKRQPQE
jgi:hypothetical protein